MCKGYFAIYNKNELNKFAFVWVERDWRYFVSNTSFLKPGIPYARDRLRQVDDNPNAYLFCVEFDINQPRVDEIYYCSNLKIDESNHTRKDYFQL